MEYNPRVVHDSIHDIEIIRDLVVRMASQGTAVLGCQGGVGGRQICATAHGTANSGRQTTGARSPVMMLVGFGISLSRAVKQQAPDSHNAGRGHMSHCLAGEARPARECRISYVGESLASHLPFSHIGSLAQITRRTRIGARATRIPLNPEKGLPVAQLVPSQSQRQTFTSIATSHDVSPPSSADPGTPPLPHPLHHLGLPVR